MSHPFMMLTYKESTYLDPICLALAELFGVFMFMVMPLDLIEVITRSSWIRTASAFGWKSLSRVGLLSLREPKHRYKRKIFYFRI